MEMLTLIDLAGSVALLLWGVHMVQTGVQRACGARLNSLLARMLGNRFQAFLTGSMLAQHLLCNCSRLMCLPLHQPLC